MASSGTYTFQMTRDDIISAALRLTGRFATGETIPVEDMNNCAQALNIITKEMVLEGLPLWCVQDIAIPLVAGQGTYNLSTITGIRQPIRVLDGYLRNAVGNDTPLPMSSRYDYDTLGMKNQQGVPNQAFYDPQLGACAITLYPIPVDALSTYHVVIQRQLQDFNLSTDNPDFPQEAFRLLKWCLADEIALEYQTPEGIRREFNQKAAHLREKFFAYQQEQAPIYFTPTERRA